VINTTAKIKTGRGANRKQLSLNCLFIVFVFLFFPAKIRQLIFVGLCPAIEREE